MVEWEDLPTLCVGQVAHALGRPIQVLGLSGPRTGGPVSASRVFPFYPFSGGAKVPCRTECPRMQRSPRTPAVLVGRPDEPAHLVTGHGDECDPADRRTARPARATTRTGADRGRAGSGSTATAEGALAGTGDARPGRRSVHHHDAVRRWSRRRRGPCGADGRAEPPIAGPPCTPVDHLVGRRRGAHVLALPRTPHARDHGLVPSAVDPPRRRPDLPRARQGVGEHPSSAPLRRSRHTFRWTLGGRPGEPGEPIDCTVRTQKAYRRLMTVASGTCVSALTPESPGSASVRVGQSARMLDPHRSFGAGPRVAQGRPNRPAPRVVGWNCPFL